MTLIIGNAPCSWGSLEFDGLEAAPVRYPDMLDELTAAGYLATDLGDWGYMPDTPALLAATLSTRRLALSGAFVPVALKDPAALAPGQEQALRTAHLIAEAARRLDQPYLPLLILADANGTDPVRTANAGRITPAHGLSAAQWRTFARGATQIAAAVLKETGLRTAFHHHCAGYVETPAEITRLLEMTDPALLGLCLDTGHFAYGAGTTDSLLPALDRFHNRIFTVHFKDYEPAVGRTARENSWDYFDAVRHGVFCELGKGSVDFPAVVDILRRYAYAGYITVEQDVLPGLGAPAESARRNRDYLRSIGL